MPTPKNFITKTPTTNVLHIASGDLWAGAEVMLYTHAKTLHANSDIKVTIILLNPGTLEKKLRNCGISVYVLDESHLNIFQILKRLNKIIIDVNPDVIHTHRVKENILGSITAWRQHIPSLRTVHGAPENRPPLYKLAKRLILLLDWLTGRYFQQTIIAVSPDLASKLEQSFPKTKIKVIENGIDIDTTISGASPAKSNGSNKSGYRIGFAGRLVAVKRIELFIQAAICLRQQQPELPVHFYIYGDGPMRDSLQALVQSKHMNDYIHFEGHCDNVLQKLYCLDAIVMTSEHEGLPMVLLEAMSLQIPIIACAVGGIPNLLDHNKCGTLIHNCTPENFSQAIINLINHPEAHKQLSLQAFERVRQHYSAKHSAESYLNLYDHLIS